MYSFSQLNQSLQKLWPQFLIYFGLWWKASTLKTIPPMVLARESIPGGNTENILKDGMVKTCFLLKCTFCWDSTTWKYLPVSWRILKYLQPLYAQLCYIVYFLELWNPLRVISSNSHWKLFSSQQRLYPDQCLYSYHMLSAILSKYILWLLLLPT